MEGRYGMKYYKVWMEIEEYDTETEDYRDLCDAGEVEPVPLGWFDSLDEAVSTIESMADSIGVSKPEGA